MDRRQNEPQESYEMCSGPRLRPVAGLRPASTYQIALRQVPTRAEQRSGQFLLSADVRYARAYAQSRKAVARDTPSASAASCTDKPVKRRSRATAAELASSDSSVASASSTASTVSGSGTATRSPSDSSNRFPPRRV